MNELIPFECPYCSHRMEIPARLDGKEGTCPGCNRMITLTLSSWQSGQDAQQAEGSSTPGPPPPAGIPPGAATFVPGPPPSFAGTPALMSDTLWRKGNLLAFHKYAPLPNICLKSNQPATQQLKRNLSWHPPSVYIGLLLGLLPFVIIALILTKKATIYIGLSDEWVAIRKQKIARSWGIVLLSIALGIGLPVLGGITNQGPGFICPAVACALVLFFVGLCYGSYGARLVSPDRITEDFVYLKGVHPDFLARLPEWPFPDKM